MPNFAVTAVSLPYAWPPRESGLPEETFQMFICNKVCTLVHIISRGDTNNRHKWVQYYSID